MPSRGGGIGTLLSKKVIKGCICFNLSPEDIFSVNLCRMTGEYGLASPAIVMMKNNFLVDYEAHPFM